MKRARVIWAIALLALASPAAARAQDTPPGCAPPSLTGGDWRSYGGDPANTRNQPAERVISAADVPSLTSAWVFSSVENGGAGDFTGTPIVADGCMYIASTRGWVFAVNADTGKLVWKTKVPHGGGVNSSVAVAQRTLPAAAVKGVKKKKHHSRRHRRHRKRHARAKARRAAAAPRTAGTIYVAVTRTQKFESCPPGDPCVGPYVVALDQASGQVVWSSLPVDTQPGADVYASPVVYDGALMIGVSGGAAE
ncbi:MAG: PQQ-binding-like beta-propeller repeat protein, partial [Thermoleophilaceae bacterium]